MLNERHSRMPIGMLVHLGDYIRLNIKIRLSMHNTTTYQTIRLCSAIRYMVVQNGMVAIAMGATKIVVHKI